MLKQLSIITGAAALAAPIAMFAWPGDTPRGTAQATEASAAAPIQVVAVHPNYDAGMRIIHVPEADVIAAYPRRSHRQLNVEQPAPPKAKHQQIAMPKPPQPRRILPPPVTQPKRAVLSAPPPSPNGLTPIRPTPRWRSIEKFTMPPEEKPRSPVEPAQSSDVNAPSSTETAATTPLPAVSETVEAPLSPVVTETAAAPGPPQESEIDDDSPPPAD